MISIENAIILYGDEMEVKRGNVLIEDDKIIEVSKRSANKALKIDAEGSIVAPALINSHVHIGDSVALDKGDGKVIDEIIKPPHGLKHRILRDTPHSEIIDSMKTSMMRMLESGTTTFVDFREGGIEGINLLNEASKDIPIRKIVLGRDESFIDVEADRFHVRRVVKKLLTSCDGIAPSGFGEISDDIAQIITDICRSEGKISAIHVAEYEELQKESIKATGKSEVERAIEAGFDLLVHLTSPEKDDLRFLANNNSSAVCCPRSNGILTVGIPPLGDLVRHNINTLLGTDNLMFNSPNMLREMEYALKVTRGYYEEYFAPVEIFKMATVNAARALKLNTGCIKEGKMADIMIVKQISKDPILSLINRTEPGSIRCLMKEGEIIYNK